MRDNVASRIVKHGACFLFTMALALIAMNLASDLWRAHGQELALHTDSVSSVNFHP